MDFEDSGDPHGDLGPAVGIGRVVLVILAVWIAVLGIAAWWAFS